MWIFLSTHLSGRISFWSQSSRAALNAGQDEVEHSKAHDTMQHGAQARSGTKT